MDTILQHRDSEIWFISDTPSQRQGNRPWSDRSRYLVTQSLHDTFLPCHLGLEWAAPTMEALYWELTVLVAQPLSLWAPAHGHELPAGADILVPCEGWLKVCANSRCKAGSKHNSETNCEQGTEMWSGLETLLRFCFGYYGHSFGHLTPKHSALKACIPSGLQLHFRRCIVLRNTKDWQTEANTRRGRRLA